MNNLIENSKNRNAFVGANDWPGDGLCNCLALGYGLFIRKFTVLKSMKHITHLKRLRQNESKLFLPKWSQNIIILPPHRRRQLIRFLENKNLDCSLMKFAWGRIKLEPLCRARLEQKRLRRRKRLARRRFC